MEKRSARPEPELRFYVDGQQVDGPAFWQAVRDLGGQATVVAHDPKPVPEEAPRYTLTPLGRRVLAQEEAGE